MNQHRISGRDLRKLTFGIFVFQVAAMLLSGCGIGGVVVIAALTESSDEDNPIGGIQNTIPVVYVSTPTRQVGDVSILYRITDLESDNCSITAAYGAYGADPVNPLTLSAASPLLDNVTSSMTGIDHTLIWNSIADLGNGYKTDVVIAVTASDGKGNSATQVTATFAVGNNAPGIELLPISGTQSGAVGILYIASDNSSDLINLEAEFSLDNSSPWISAVPVAGIAMTNILTSPVGLQHVFLWDSLDNVGGVGSAISDQCRIRLRAFDGFDNGIWTESDFFTIHNNFPPSASITEIGTPGAGEYRGVIPIRYTLYDTESDSIDAVFEWADGSGVWKRMSEFPAGSGGMELSDGAYNLSASPEGVSHTFLWNSLSDTITDHNFIRFRIRPDDPYQSGIIGEVLFNAKVSNHAFYGMRTSHQTPPTYYATAIGDFDNNGYGDIVIPDSGSNGIDVAYGAPNCFVRESGSMFANSPSLEAEDHITGDFCYNDGVDDLAYFGASGLNYLIFMAGVSGYGLNASSIQTDTSGGNLVCIASGDFNNDGMADVVTCGSGLVYIRAGQDGAFPAANYILDAGLSGVVSDLEVADINNDGIDDILGINDGLKNLMVWPGSDGSLPGNASRSDYSVDTLYVVHDIGVGDFNGDNCNDFGMLIGPEFVYWAGVSGSVPDNNSVLRGEPGASSPVDIWSADFNLDDYDDLLFNFAFLPGGTPECRVIPGSASGLDFSNSQIYSGDLLVPGICGDFTGNGTGQFIYNSADARRYVLEPGKGDFPTLDSEVFITENVHFAIYADISGDGMPDFPTRATFGEMETFFLRDTCGFIRDSGVDKETGLGVIGYSLTIADFNADGIKDLLTPSRVSDMASYYPGYPGSEPPADSALEFDISATPKIFFSADITGDGIEDGIVAIATWASGKAFIFPGKAGLGPDGNSAIAIQTSGEISNFAAGDFDNNGCADLVFDEGEFYGGIYWLAGPVDATYQNSDLDKISSVVALYHRIVVGDFNGDGIDDIVASNDNESAVFNLYQGIDGIGLTNSNLVTRPKMEDIENMIVCDLNCDGCDDLTYVYDSIPQCEIYYGNSSTGLELTQSVSIALPAQGQHLAAGDVNADGWPDLVVTLKSAGLIVCLNQDGAGVSAASSTQHDFDCNGGFVNIADVNNDGISDIVAGELADNLYYLLGTPGEGPKSEARGKLDIGIYINGIITDDINADGMADVIVKSGERYTRIWLSQPGRQTLSFALGNNGGIFRHPKSDTKFLKDFVLNVPSGAVLREYDIAILHPEKRELPSPDGEFWRPISKPLLLMRETLMLAVNASLTIPISEAVAEADWTNGNESRIAVLRYERETDTWTEWSESVLAINATAGIITLSIERFGYYVVALKP
ncbi:MAG: FG-GAP repeat domain-containing protein [Planctomycetota bacterium]|jgi:hypothetical protein